jgi:c-di-GMP-binding flagellar brake protein YcgR
MNDGLEKRKFQRLECPLEGTIKIVPVKEAPNNLPPLHIKSRNISKNGICLEIKPIEVEGINLPSGLPFAREHRIYMNIELIPNEQLFEAIGEVRWYDILRDEYIYQVGVAFIDIKDNGKEQLLRFLKTHKSNRGYFHKLFK